MGEDGFGGSGSGFTIGVAGSNGSNTMPLSRLQASTQTSASQNFGFQRC